MRRQDEIADLLSRAQGPFERLVIDLAGDLSPVFDSGRVVDLIAGRLQGTDRTLRVLAQLSMRTFAGFWFPARWRIAAPAAGVWTGLHLRKKAIPPGPPPPEDLARHRSLSSALRVVLDPLVGPLVRGLSSPDDPLFALQVECLAGIPSPASVEALQTVLVSTGSAEVGVAMAGSPRAQEGVLDYLVRCRKIPQPQVVAGLRCVDPQHPAAGRFVERSLASRDPEEALAGAIALGGHPHLARGLVSGEGAVRDPWVQAHALVALARTASGIALARSTYAGAGIALLRALAVRAAGAVPGPEADAVVRQAAAEGTGPAQALALELAARRGLELTSSLLSTLTASPHARVRLNAALLLAATDPEAAFPSILHLLTSTVDAERATGAFALAYVQDEASDRVLLRLLTDPSPAVRREAVTSLSRHTSPRAMAALERAATTLEEPDLAIHALEALAWAGGPGLDAIAQRLAAAPVDHGDPRFRAELFRTLGSLAADGTIHPPGALARGLESTDAVAAAGALDGAMVCGLTGEVLDHLHRDVRSDPVIRVRLLLARLVGGDLDAVGPLATALSPASSARREALIVLLELSSLSRWLGRTPRLAALERALEPRAAAHRVASEPLPITPDDRCPAESDPDLSHGARWVPRLPSRAHAIADLPHPKSNPGTRRSLAYYAPPEPAHRWIGLWPTLALTSLVVAVALARRATPAEPIASPRAPVVTSPRPVSLALAWAKGPVETVPADRLWARRLWPRDSVRARPGGHLALRGPYPGITITVGPGLLTIDGALGRDARRLGIDLAVTVEEGTYRFDLRPGASKARVRVPGGSLLADDSAFTLEVTSRGGRVRVGSGSVDPGGLIGRAVLEGESVGWGDAPPAGDEGPW